jgi:uncharacterized integral membrane protein
MIRFLIFLFFLALILCFFIFTLENLDLVSLNLIVEQYQVPLGLTVLVCFVLGALIGVLFSLTLILKYKHKVRSLNKRIAMAEQEIAKFRQRPTVSMH